ncbi:hypothetical protein [Hoeflea ulvae]|uniref:Flagellar protein FliL n=1 Tax=Hoeflea ulvae TaxID=2983764 RepID=A0ABT3YCX6_9HYPH|nr:hypothetical protein [Hoeflea ulvae]MCY0093542.1 hypothetical protein [Hoeflea ulvae]
MIKLLVTGVWITAVALASVYFSIQSTNTKESAEPEADMFGGLETIRGEVTSIPVISDGAVQGYFLTRLSYTVDTDKSDLLTIPLQVLVIDELYSALVGEQLIDFPSLSKFNLEAFKVHIREALNARLGEMVFHDIIVEQIDFLSKSDIRSNMREGRFTMKAGEPIGQVDAAPEGASPGH